MPNEIPLTNLDVYFIKACMEWDMRVNITYRVDDVDITYFFQRVLEEPRTINKRGKTIWTDLRKVICVGYRPSIYDDYKKCFQKTFTWNYFLENYLEIGYSSASVSPYLYSHKKDEKNLHTTLQKVEKYYRQKYGYKPFNAFNTIVDNVDSSTFSNTVFNVPEGNVFNVDIFDGPQENDQPFINNFKGMSWADM